MGLPMLRDWLHERHQLHMARWMLEFDEDESEHAFRKYDDDHALGTVRFAQVVGLLFNAAYGVVDLLILPEVSVGALITRTVLVVIFAVGIVTLPRFTLAQRHLQVGSVLLLTTVQVALGPVLAQTGDFPTDYIRTSAAVTLLGGVGLLRLRMHAAIANTVVFVAVCLTLPGAFSSVDGMVDVLPPTAGLAAISVLIAYALEKLRRQDFLAQREIELEQERSEALINNVLPPTIAKRLRTEQGAIADSAPVVSVLFSDIVGFTPLSETLDPAVLVRLLDTMFREFDELCDRHGVEKVKTVGDAYMAVSGLPDPNPDHAASMAELALDMQRAVARLSHDWPSPISLRIGIASGPAVAGVIGQRKFAYDLWGDTVNTASRMESHSRPNRIQVAAATHALLEGRYAFSEAQQIEVKGKGVMTTYFLLGRAPGLPKLPALSSRRSAVPAVP